MFVVFGLTFAITNQLGCNSDKNPFVPKEYVIFDAGIGRELLYQPTRVVPQNVEKYFQPGEKQVDEMHQYLGSVISMKCHSNLIDDAECVTNLEDYIYQYVGITMDNENYIYVNAAKKDHPFLKWVHWKKSALTVSDGGNDFWGVLYCVRTKRFSQLSINAYI